VVLSGVVVRLRVGAGAAATMQRRRATLEPHCCRCRRLSNVALLV
jgi:hypothetical protein